jgi:hypothetical protein
MLRIMIDVQGTDAGYTGRELRELLDQVTRAVVEDGGH